MQSRTQSKAQEIGRYAPSTTGPAHPGTLLAALLCWLDARSRGARVELRLEDLDPQRCRPELGRAMREDLAWLGLEWDATREQRAARASHEAALDRLEEMGVLYPCHCSRSQIRRSGERSPDGGYRYPNICRERALPPRSEGGWRASDQPLRARIPHGVVAPIDEGGLDLSQDPALAFGDPVVRRRDGAIAYHLASVVDDAESGVTRIVRGRDLAASSATQAKLRELLGLPEPVYHHHFLLLERSGDKLAKLHGSVGVSQLRRSYSAEELCGVLAFAADLLGAPEPVTPGALLGEFAWDRVRTQDRVASWDGSARQFSGDSECFPCARPARWPDPRKPRE